jgi:hypothetical protein
MYIMTFPCVVIKRLVFFCIVHIIISLSLSLSLSNIHLITYFQPSSHVTALSIISAVGCGISTLFLTTTLIVYAVLWRCVTILAYFSSISCKNSKCVHVCVCYLSHNVYLFINSAISSNIFTT